MKFNTEDTLYNLDQALAAKPQKDVMVIYLLILVGPIFISYMLFWDSAELGYNKTKKERIALEKKIAEDKQYLASHPESLIAKIENETKAIEAKFLEYQDNNAYIKYQIEQISSLFYDEQAWGEYLDSVATNAKKYNMKLIDFKNKFADDREAFGHVLDISVESHGSFHNTMRYINSLEQSFLVVDIHDFVVETNSTLRSDLNISVWGITY